MINIPQLDYNLNFKFNKHKLVDFVFKYLISVLGVF